MITRLRILRVLRPIRFAKRHESSRSKSRFSLAVAVVSFAIATLGIAIWSDRTDSFRDPIFSDMVGHLRANRDSKRGPSILFIGSSRVGNGFDAGRAEAELCEKTGVSVSVSNFGVPGSGPITNLIYLERIWKARLLPNYLFIEVLPGTLHEQTAGPVEKQWLDLSRLSRNERVLVNRLSASFALLFCCLLLSAPF